jgi:hypothetical protein
LTVKKKFFDGLFFLNFFFFVCLIFFKIIKDEINIVKKDGEYFLNELNAETRRLLALCSCFKEYLADATLDINEESKFCFFLMSHLLYY